jgi:YHS domain-containing protein
MVRQLLKKSCKRCGRPFFTYELDKTFCNDICEARFKYDEHFGVEDYLKENSTYCENCNELIELKGVKSRRFCNEYCKKQFDKKQRSIASEGKPKKKGKGLPYEVLNMIEEKKRVFGDHDWLYKRNRDKI